MVLGNMNYIDASILYISSIKIVKNILKGIVYVSLIIFTFLEAKLDKKISKIINKVKKSWFFKELVV